MTGDCSWQRPSAAVRGSSSENSKARNPFGASGNSENARNSRSVRATDGRARTAPVFGAAEPRVVRNKRQLDGALLRCRTGMASAVRRTRSRKPDGVNPSFAG